MRWRKGHAGKAGRLPPIDARFLPVYQIDEPVYQIDEYHVQAAWLPLVRSVRHWCPFLKAVA